ncbi:hypothetical protein Ancab_001153 [Ancistrocladus abbreviatus]
MKGHCGFRRRGLVPSSCHDLLQFPGWHSCFREECNQRKKGLCTECLELALLVEEAPDVDSNRSAESGLKVKTYESQSCKSYFKSHEGRLHKGKRCKSSSQTEFEGWASKCLIEFLKSIGKTQAKNNLKMKWPQL